MVYKCRGAKPEFRVSTKMFPSCDLVRGGEPMIPLYGLAGYIEGRDVDLLVRWDMMIGEKMLDLEKPREDMLAGKQRHFQFG